MAFIRSFSFMCATLMALVTVSSAFLVSSSYSVRNFSRVDLAPNLRTFIDHEEIRLKVLKGLNDTETEIPLVEQRLATFKAMEKSLEVNKTNTAFQKSMKSNHPTSIFNAVRNYMSEFSNRYDNRTLYGDRFREFITKDLTGPVPDHQDLHRVGMALSVIENVYNFNMEELHKGIVGGHQGEPLSCADMYDIALTMISDGLLAGASQWMEAALHDMDMDNLKREDMTFDVSSALSMLARVAFAKDDKDKCLKLYEKAIELEPEDEDLYKEYVSHRFGREVNKLDELDVDSVEEWRKSFFRLCRVSLTLEGDNVYEVGNKTNQRLHCRYKPSAWTPYAVYREEIVSVSPFISIIYNFISDAQADEVINKTQDKLDHFVLPGNDRVTLWQFKGDLFKDQDYPVIANVSWKVGDVAHMNVKQKTKKTQVSFGEPIHVMDYGISGLALPHAEFKKEYHTAYMNIDNGKRFATMTVPLADVAVGGAIVFINQNVTIAPKKGMGILYYSWTPAGMQENDLYVGTCPLAVGENIVLEKGLWWTIYDTTNYCGKKKHSNHLARERIIANHKALVAAQKPKLELNEEYLKKEVAKAKAALKVREVERLAKKALDPVEIAKKLKKAEEAARKIKEAEEKATKVKAEEEAARQAKVAEEASRKAKAEEEAARKAKVAKVAEEAARKIKEATEAKEAARKVKEAELAKEEAAKKVKAAEEAAKKIKEAEEADKKVKETEDAAKKIKEAEKAAKKLKEAEESAKKEKEAEETAKKAKEAEEVAKKLQEAEEAANKIKEAKEADKKMKEAEESARKEKEAEETAKKVKEAEEAAKKVKEAEEAAKKIKEAKEAAKKVKEAEELAKQVKEAEEAATKLKKTEEEAKKVKGAEEFAKKVKEAEEEAAKKVEKLEKKAEKAEEKEDKDNKPIKKKKPADTDKLKEHKQAINKKHEEEIQFPKLEIP